MKTAAELLVIDASILAAWFLQEAGQPAQQLIAGPGELLAPELIYAEVGNVIWKRWRNGQFDEKAATELINDLLEIPMQTTPSAELAQIAMSLSVQIDQTFYDCLYVALAVEQDCLLFTSDKRLVNATLGHPVSKHIQWIG